MQNFLKTTILFILLFAFALGFKSCRNTQSVTKESMFEENPPFEISDAYFQKWVAGTMEGGSGVQVYLVFESLESEVLIKDIYFQNQMLRAQNVVNNQNEYFADFSNSSKRDIVMDINPIKETENTLSDNFPFDLKKNEAVVSYLFREKTNYFKISNLSEKERISYPQSNPKSQN